MTYDQLRQSTEDFVSAADIAEILRYDPQALRTQAHTKPEQLGFPVTVVGTRCRFPRKAFLQYLDGEALQR